MHLTIQCAKVVQPAPDADILRWLNLAIKAELNPQKKAGRISSSLTKQATITVRFVGSKESQLLNQQYRNKDYATNVLTFAYSVAPLHADLVLCTPVLRREAKEQGKHVVDHFAHLLIHGALHARGFDHETRADANLMEALEINLLKRLGIANPYT